MRSIHIKSIKQQTKVLTGQQSTDFGSGFNVQSTMAFPPQGKIYIHAGLKIYYSTNEGSSWEYYHIHVNGQQVTVSCRKTELLSLRMLIQAFLLSLL